MRFSILISLAAAVSAFFIPEGQPDGVYSVSISADGTENHTLLSSPSTASKRSTSLSIRGSTLPISKRSGVVTCDFNEGLLNGNDNGNAATGLANQCGNGVAIPGGVHIYSISHCSVAFFCNFKEDTQVCTALNAWNSFSDINRLCQPNTPGWETYFDTDGKDVYGYQWVCTFPGSAFCAT